MKFRIYDPLTKIMEDFSFKTLSTSPQGAILTEGGICIGRDDVIIMRYLGDDTKDVDGVNLCELDICKFVGIKGMITYKNNGFRFEYQLGKLGYHWAGDANFEWTKLKKIGNFCQHPDLVNGI